jgi:hypothetical protein
MQAMMMILAGQLDKFIFVIKSTLITVLFFPTLSHHTVPKDSENFVTNNYGAGLMFLVTKVFVIDSCRPVAIVISNEIY